MVDYGECCSVGLPVASAAWLCSSGMPTTAGNYSASHSRLQTAGLGSDVVHLALRLCCMSKGCRMISLRAWRNMWMPLPLPLPHVGLWRGLGPRILMVGTLTSLQFFIFDAVKVVMRLPRPPPPEMPASLRAKWEGRHAT